MGSSSERDLKEQELALLRKSIEECRVKREAQEQRLISLEKHMDERPKAFYGDIDAKEREYDAIRRRVEERNWQHEMDRYEEICSEFEAKEEKLKLIQKHIRECEMQLRLKEETSNWQHEMAHQVITERDNMQREIEECANNLRAKQGRLVLIEDLIAEREQELMAKVMEFHQHLDNIHRDSEAKKDELRALSEKIVQCNMELRTKEEELDAMKRLINEQGNQLDFKKKDLIKVQGQVQELESIQKHIEGQVKDLESKEKQFQGQVKELESKQKHFEGQVKEFESKEKRFQGQVKELESKQKHFEGQVKELESKEKLFVGQMKDLESKKNQFEWQVKELDLKEAQFMDKISDFVQNLVQNQQRIEAVRFICAYKLAYKIQPVDLLRQHMLKAKLISKRICRKKKSIEKKVKGRDTEIAILETILQCISDNNLESQDLVNEIQDRILVLEQIKENIVLYASEPSSKIEVQHPGGKNPANKAVNKDQIKVQQPGGKKPANEAVTKNQVKVQQTRGKKRSNEAVSKNQVQQPANKKPANEAVSKNQVKVQQHKEKKHANEAVSKNQVKVQQHKEKKHANKKVTKNQVQQPGEKKPASEAVPMNQVRVQQPKKKKRAIEAAHNDHQVQKWGNNRKRPRTVVPVPSVFPPQHHHVFTPVNERVIPRPNGIPAQFMLPPNYFGFTNPVHAEWRGNTGTNYYGSSWPYPPFR